ncbi:hypothetical protein BKA81DRAFT_145744 [Phyllosticta paracitricarpa]
MRSSIGGLHCPWACRRGFLLLEMVAMPSDCVVVRRCSLSGKYRQPHTSTVHVSLRRPRELCFDPIQAMQTHQSFSLYAKPSNHLPIPSSPHESLTTLSSPYRLPLRKPRLPRPSLPKTNTPTLVVTVPSQTHRSLPHKRTKWPHVLPGPPGTKRSHSKGQKDNHLRSMWDSNPQPHPGDLRVNAPDQSYSA